MKKRFFTIGIVVAVPLLIMFILGGIGLFSTPNTIIDDYRMYEKQLGKLFEKYEKKSDAMTDAERNQWKNEVEQLNQQAVDTLIEIQKNPEHWTSYLASKGEPYTPSPFAEREYTGLAAKSFKDVSSDDFDAWLQARDQAYEEEARAEMRAEGIWDDETIEKVIADINQRLTNDPQRQEHREKMRQHVLRKESAAKRRLEYAREKREEAAYQAKREKDKAWMAAEEARLLNGEWGLSDTQDIVEDRFDPSDADDDNLTPRLPENTSVDVPIPAMENDTPHTSPKPLRPDVFDPAVVSDTLSKDMSRWEDDLMESYPELFRLKDDQKQSEFEQSLPQEVRQHFQQRKQRMQQEYVRRLQTFLSDTPNEQRTHTLRIVREKLENNWNRDFAESVLKQLQFDDE